MTREKKKNTSGAAKAFISRPKALKKLQISLTEFRRLCILKGIFPRNPRKKLDGSDKTYYLRKDINFLAHERLISTIREENAHQKKVVRARSTRRLDVLKRLALNTPRARLDHLIVERFPRFEDAIRELDDPLCIVALFANLPAEKRVGISPHRIANCQRLLREFCNWVVKTNSLRRVFVSIKGYYFQARICNMNVTWITPHRFSQYVPHDVDYSVMLTFLELYECILSFVNFRLYTSQNLAYPPRVDRPAAASALELGSLLVEQLPSTNNMPGEDDIEFPDQPAVAEDIVKQAEQIAADAANEEEEDDEDDESDDENAEDNESDIDENNDESAAQNGDEVEDDDDDKDDSGDEDENDEKKRKENEVKDKETSEPKSDNETEKTDKPEKDVSGVDETPSKGIFSEKCVVIGREVPFIEVEFVLRAAGAIRVTREGDLPFGDDRLLGYTHWIIDRPAVSGQRDMSLEYVQPQYVFDSVNANMLLPPSLYAPGAHLPPHLSPFVTAADEGGYKTWYEDVLERIKQGDESVVQEAAAVVYKEGEALAKQLGLGDEGDSGDDGDDEDMEEDDDNQVEEEDDVEGEEEKQLAEKQMKSDKQEKGMAAVMLSRKQQRLYRKAKGKEQRKEAIKQKLTEKRKQVEADHEEIISKSKKRRKTLA